MLYSNCTDGDVRLVDGSVAYEGRVELCINRAWGSTCYGNGYWWYNYWDINDATVVCRQLGHQERGKFVVMDNIIATCVYDYYIQYLPN